MASSVVSYAPPLPPLKAFGLYFSCFFVTVATILGTGILALPVKLSRTGFTPFVLVFGVCLVMQMGTAILMVELLQRTHVRMANMPESVGKGARPDLHTMGNIYMTKSLRTAFDLSVMMHFMSILISYALAGATAYAQILGTSVAPLITPFVLLLTPIIVFGHKYIAFVISFITIPKCILLLFMIGVVGRVASDVDVSSHEEWSSIAEPFLLGTVALGGGFNLMPVLYEKVPYNPISLGRFRFAICFGVGLCWLLNIIWTYFIIHIVPQTAPNDKPSLERAQENGEISTVPVIEVIEADFPQYHWVSIGVEAFVTMSVTVSYLTLGSGMKHVLDGMVLQLQTRLKSHSEPAPLKRIESPGPGSPTVRERSRTPSTPSAAATGEEDDVVDLGARGIEEDEVRPVVPPEADSSIAETKETEPTGDVVDLGDGLDAPSPGETDTRVSDGAAAWRSSGSGAPSSSRGPSGRPDESQETFLVKVVNILPPAFARFDVQRGITYGLFFGLVLIIALLNPSAFLVVLEVFTSFALNAAGFMVVTMYCSARDASKGSDITAPLNDTWALWLPRIVGWCFVAALVFDLVTAISDFWHPVAAAWLSVWGCMLGIIYTFVNPDSPPLAEETMSLFRDAPTLELPVKLETVREKLGLETWRLREVGFPVAITTLATWSLAISAGLCTDRTMVGVGILSVSAFTAWVAMTVALAVWFDQSTTSTIPRVWAWCWVIPVFFFTISMVLAFAGGCTGVGVTFLLLVVPLSGIHAYRWIRTVSWLNANPGKSSSSSAAPPSGVAHVKLEDEYGAGM